MGRPKGSKNKPKAPQVEYATLDSAPAQAAPVVEVSTEGVVKRRGRPPKDESVPTPAAVAPAVVKLASPIPAGAFPVKRRGRPAKEGPPGSAGIKGNWTDTAQVLKAQGEVMAEPPPVKEAVQIKELPPLKEDLVSDVTLMSRFDTPKKFPSEWQEYRKRANREGQIIKFFFELDTAQLINAQETLESFESGANTEMGAAIKFLLEEVTGKLLEIKEQK